MHPRLLSVCSVMTLCPIIAVASPDPLKLSVPRAPGVMADASGSQIKKIIMTPSRTVPGIYLSEPIGEAWTLAFWIKLNEDPRLQSKEFTLETPETLVDFMTADPKADQRRLIVRVMDGKFSVTEQNDGKWKELKGISVKVSPGDWYCLTYTRTATSGVFYIDGDIIARTAGRLPAQDGLRTLVFGNFNKLRVADGTVMFPRLYAKALSREEVLELLKDRPDGSQ